MTTPTAATQLRWVQGMEKPNPKHTMPWQELLLRRLLGLFENVPTGEGTKAAEDALEFPDTMAYYYIGRCVPSFGHNVVASRPVTDRSLTTPFDTGALVDSRGLIRTSPVLDAAGRVALVREFSYSGRDYEPHLDGWLEAAFAHPAEYITGARPSAHSVEAFLLEECTGDARIWTWEARIRATDYASPPTETVLVLFAAGTRERYLDWVLDTELLTAGERLTHVRDVYGYSEETIDPVPDMLEYLQKELTP